MKKLFYLVSICALTAMPFTFTSCSDDDDPVVAPSGAVSNLSFTDTDKAEGKIGGTLTWTLPDAETGIDGYAIYLGGTATEKKTKAGEVTKGTKSFDIPTGTDLQAYLIVVARNATGESANMATLAVTDNEGLPIVTNPSFVDVDRKPGQIAGTLSWTAPADDIEAITGYAIYAGNSSDDEGTKIGEAAADATSFEIPEGTAYKAYLRIVTLSTYGQSSFSVAIEDVYTKIGGFYILNSGNWEANNASLSYYDYTTGELSTEVYKKANGKGLGDGAEQLLVYGSKMYITVSGSNRLVVLDRDAKEIKSITPAGEPMNPRCMIADNGKVYISYYYGHSVAILDTASLEIEKEVKVGRYPEQLAIANGKIYVANSGGLDYNEGYAKTVSVIDQGTLTVDKEIEVIVNPTQLAADSQGDIYVISMGNYGDIKNTLQRIDGQSGKVTVIDNATSMRLVDDELYTLFGQWGESKITFKKYNALTEEVISDNFIQDADAISPNNSPVLAVNPVSKQLLILEAPYGATGSLYMFTPDGKLEGKAIDTGGYASKWVTFINE
jgi:YVTN family beta-propeller protein